MRLVDPQLTAEEHRRMARARSAKKVAAAVPVEAYNEKISAAVDALEQAAQHLKSAGRLLSVDESSDRLTSAALVARLTALFVAFTAGGGTSSELGPPVGAARMHRIARGLYGADSDTEARLVILTSLDWFARNSDTYERDDMLMQLKMLLNCFTGRKPSADGGLTTALSAAIDAWAAVSKGGSHSKWDPTNRALAIVGLGCNSPEALCQVWKTRPRNSKLPR